MGDDNLASLAKDHPEELNRMIDSETARQGDVPMNRAELLESQRWIAQAEAAIAKVAAIANAAADKESVRAWKGAQRRSKLSKPSDVSE